MAFPAWGRVIVSSPLPLSLSLFFLLIMPQNFQPPPLSLTEHVWLEPSLQLGLFLWALQLFFFFWTRVIFSVVSAGKIMFFALSVPGHRGQQRPPCCRKNPSTQFYQAAASSRSLIFCSAILFFGFLQLSEWERALPSLHAQHATTNVC